MNAKNEIIDQLKIYLTRQLEAYHKNDFLAYHELEKEILKIENKL
jgi:hypothetical protein